MWTNLICTVNFIIRRHTQLFLLPKKNLLSAESSFQNFTKWVEFSIVITVVECVYRTGMVKGNYSLHML